ncbi:hypothetical protein [Streptomyces olivochromogenes]|uniref:hypothetical protein n=1 Tax=Streptomyces olivochromogenes TaxID=1963 RepID=UPI001F351921|nr:hypothetical protein [Streptomyces olivochromogenes]MCF3133794.1 hypothetical protein [Streptomyces olivochromogenes]
MSMKRLSRPAAAGLGTLLLACGTAGLLAVPGAHAAAGGKLEVGPAKGKDTETMTLTSAGACPSNATNLIVSVTGSGFPADGKVVVGNSPLGTYGTTPAGGYVVPLTETMRDYANEAGFQKLQGRYDFTLTCRTAFNGTSLADFTAPIWFTSNTDYQSTDPNGGSTTTPSASTTHSGSATPSDTATPTDTAEPTDTGEPTDTSEPTDTAAPSDSATTGDSGGSTSGGAGGSGGSEGIGTNVNGGSGGGGGSLAHTGANAALLGSAAAALVLVGGVLVQSVRRRRLLTFADTPHHVTDRSHD